VAVLARWMLGAPHWRGPDWTDFTGPGTAGEADVKKEELGDMMLGWAWSWAFLRRLSIATVGEIICMFSLIFFS